MSLTIGSQQWMDPHMECSKGRRRVGMDAYPPSGVTHYCSSHGIGNKMDMAAPVAAAASAITTTTTTTTTPPEATATPDTAATAV
mmetsp:Transcript_58450/g.65442  ORF Transcript_58450/g.65442 Transcript_58450/m.65442 type:complete len:85 (-) Transcript_58450:182-436(-)